MASGPADRTIRSRLAAVNDEVPRRIGAWSRAKSTAEAGCRPEILAAILIRAQDRYFCEDDFRNVRDHLYLRSATSFANACLGADVLPRFVDTMGLGD
jgi:hypothetical protein